MRVALRTILFLLLVYVPGVGALIWWANLEVNRTADTVMEETAQLIGREVVSAISPDFLRQVQEGEPVNRRRMLRMIRELIEATQTVEAVSIVDQDGMVAASDDFLAVGRRLPAPDQVFGTDLRSRFLPLDGSLRHAGRYLLDIPLVADGRPVAYIRLAVSSAPIADLYLRARRRLVVGAVAGLLLIGLLGLILHVQLTRQGRRLKKRLEEALAGRRAATSARAGRRNEFAEALEAAGRLGQALSEERQRSALSQRRLSELSDLLDVGVLVVERDGELDFASPQGRELLGLPSEPAEVWGRQVLPRIRDALSTAFVSGEPLSIELAGSVEAESLQLEIQPVDDYALMTLRDRGLTRLVETDLRLAAQLRGLMRLYQGVAHDLRAPLNAIVLNLELLKQGLEDEEIDPAAERQRLRILEGELSRLRRSLGVLLSQTAPEELKPERFDLAAILEELRVLLEPQARQQGIVVEIESPGVVIIHARKDQVKQALVNIAVNALEAMPEGGRLEVTLARSRDRAQVLFADEGPGIPESIRDRIFDLHFTTKTSGTGIGLYVARSLVEAQGGEIELVKSGPSGTTLRIELPVEQDRPARVVAAL